MEKAVSRLALAVCLALPGLHASGQANEAAEAGARMAARLSLLEGEAHVTAGRNPPEQIDAALNMPLTAGESLRTERNAHLEIEFPDGSVVRAWANSAPTLVRLQPQTEIGLDDGLYYLELRAGQDPQFVVYAGELSIAPTENASFRVRVQGGQPEIAVLRGTVSVTRANSYTVDVQQGESLRTDQKDSRRYLLAAGIASEEGDAWNERRAQEVADAAANQTIARQDYAGDQGYGWSDLDSSGAWYPLPGEGLVWQPYGADASFDPYSNGSWVYAGGGYVWASGYAWGWLPYRCGSWGFFPGLGWGWQPAGGCRSFGGGWPVGGFPVKHPPHGWHGPAVPRPPASGGIAVRHPTLPVARDDRAVRLVGSRPLRSAEPVQVNGLVLRPLGAVAPPPISRGSSAVGSALRRDYPVQPGTHQPMLGVDREGVAALPGRTPVWRSQRGSQGRVEPPAGTEPAGVGQNSTVTSEPAAATTPNRQPAVPGGAEARPTYVTGWHARVPDRVPAQGVAAPPSPAGWTAPQRNNLRPVPASSPGAEGPGRPAGAGSVAPRNPEPPPQSIQVRPASPVVAQPNLRPVQPVQSARPAQPVQPLQPRMNVPVAPPSPRMNAPAPAPPAPRMSAPTPAAPPAAAGARPR